MLCVRRSGCQFAMSICVLLADADGYSNLADLWAGDAMVCRALFLSCLLDAGEHDADTLVVSKGGGRPSGWGLGGGMPRRLGAAPKLQTHFVR
jgi:hypothetical protein